MRCMSSSEAPAIIGSTEVGGLESALQAAKASAEQQAEQLRAELELSQQEGQAPPRHREGKDPLGAGEVAFRAARRGWLAGRRQPIGMVDARVAIDTVGKRDCRRGANAVATAFAGGEGRHAQAQHRGVRAGRTKLPNWAVRHRARQEFLHSRDRES